MCRTVITPVTIYYLSFIAETVWSFYVYHFTFPSQSQFYIKKFPPSHRFFFLQLFYPWTQNDEERSGRPNEVDDDQIKAIIESDHYVTVREIEEMLKIPRLTPDRHIQRLGLVKKLNIWILHKLKEIITAPKKISFKFRTNLNLLESQHIRFTFIAQI